MNKNVAIYGIASVVIAVIASYYIAWALTLGREIDYTDVTSMVLIFAPLIGLAAAGLKWENK